MNNSDLPEYIKNWGDVFDTTNGDEEYEIACNFTSHTCQKCGKMSGKHFKMSERIVGVNFPPFHENCTCMIIPYIDPEELKHNTKTAKNINGKTVRIPRNMTYAEYYQIYIVEKKQGDTLPPPYEDTGFSKETLEFWEKMKKNYRG